MLHINTKLRKEAHTIIQQGEINENPEMCATTKIAAGIAEGGIRNEPDLAIYRMKGDGSNVTDLKNPAVNFTFKNISYKDIIKNVTQSFKSGQMTAILGPSGAGKTTYLKIISGRKQKTAGTILLNGQEIKQKELRKRVAYVHQEDHLYPVLSAKEMLSYTIQMKSPEESNPDGLADKLLEDVDMIDAKDTLIGDPLEGMAGLSGGERKRLSVAQELVSCPEILFLDEPTSGLDAYTSESLIIHLKNLARQGMLVVMTIHQPSSEIFHMFDNIVLMKNGYIVYSGSPQECVESLEASGMPCPKYTNPADHLFRILGRFPEENYKAQAPESLDMDPVDANKRPQTLSSLLYESKILISRTVLCSFRNKKYLLAKCGHALFVSLITGMFLYNIPAKQPHQIETNVIGCYRTITMATFGSFSYGAISILFSDRKIFIKEYSSNYYTFLPYFVSKVVVDFLITCMHPFVGTPIVFYLSGIGSAYHILGCLLLGATAHSLGVLVASLVDTSEIALAVFPAFAYLINMLTGTDVDPDSIIPGLALLQFISPPRHAYNIMIKLHYSGASNISPRLQALVDGFVSIYTSMCVLIATYMVLIVLAAYCLKRKVMQLAKG
ncbi:ATP-binding cassette, subfamily G (WHITE), member 2 [Nematocida major]|uniref:ATP-binding cassette, subfamily G (WHITE), member 2 n=1 Tax=Nematocida major TaxID=1912982 RepID=UPI002008CBCD|nr:ATP-binding cassette, subfamily G (WHITE), member 2 [Nematocida major]KAH9385185.1 ATP-binding cassette, subfamily G (WHITE), member 2 [Nematocida major]